ncbi:hypothetical protein BpHYR1_010585 [Brachionus plicatilis]|uniref:Uncharacterized protein n=1 Tax=Brachionus plicatilis TaxID=10195 RepID=A0A3M7PRG0_BRAPC|nr:hypothetical protein BpHYR1_010585 [Brachionus plicatilis]
MRYKSGFCHNLIRFLNKNIQTTAIGLATVNISLGVFYAVFAWYWILVWFTYFGANFFLYIVLEIWKNNKKQAEINKETSDDESESEKEFSLSKTDSTQQLKPAQNKESIKMQPFRYTNSNPRSFPAKRQGSSIENSTIYSGTQKVRNGHLNYSPKINVSYIGDNEYDHEVNYVIAKKAALKEKIESLTSSPISSIGILN